MGAILAKTLELIRSPRNGRDCAARRQDVLSAHAPLACRHPAMGVRGSGIPRQERLGAASAPLCLRVGASHFLAALDVPRQQRSATQSGENSPPASAALVRRRLSTATLCRSFRSRKRSTNYFARRVQASRHRRQAPPTPAPSKLHPLGYGNPRDRNDLIPILRQSGAKNVRSRTRR